MKLTCRNKLIRLLDPTDRASFIDRLVAYGRGLIVYVVYVVYDVKPSRFCLEYVIPTKYANALLRLFNYLIPI